MGELASILYKRFFLRDFLGKIFPGALVMLGVLFTLTPPDASIYDSRFFKSFDLISASFSVACFWVLGVCIQSIGEITRFVDTFPTAKGCNRLEAYADFRRRVLFFTADMNMTEDLREQRERYVVIKEACGNTATSLFIIALFMSIMAILGYKNECNLNPFILFAIVISMVICWKGYVMHCSRQAHFEIDVLALYNHPGIDEMRRRAGEIQ